MFAKIKTLSLLVIIAIFSACGDKLVEEVINTHPNGLPNKITYHKKSDPNKEVVREVLFYPNGEKRQEGEFKEGMKHGKWTYWYENGNKWSEGSFEDGLSNGKTIVWDKEGNINYTGYYKNGISDGTWTFYNAESKKVKEVVFENARKIKETDY